MKAGRFPIEEDDVDVDDRCDRGVIAQARVGDGDRAECISSTSNNNGGILVVVVVVAGVVADVVTAFDDDDDNNDIMFSIFVFHT